MKAKTFTFVTTLLFLSSMSIPSMASSVSPGGSGGTKNPSIKACAREKQVVIEGMLLDVKLKKPIFGLIPEQVIYSDQNSVLKSFSKSDMFSKVTLLNSSRIIGCSEVISPVKVVQTVSYLNGVIPKKAKNQKTDILVPSSTKVGLTESMTPNLMSPEPIVILGYDIHYSTLNGVMAITRKDATFKVPVVSEETTKGVIAVPYYGLDKFSRGTGIVWFGNGTGQKYILLFSAHPLSIKVTESRIKEFNGEEHYGVDFSKLMHDLR